MIYICKELQTREYVVSAEPKKSNTGAGWFSTTPNDTYLSNQWALNKIQAYDAWDKTTGSSEVKVGLIDSGINNTHEDLSANISTTLSYGTNPYEDVAPHGTMTAGVIGAVGNNNKGISGVCWNVDIVSLKAVNSSRQEDMCLRKI